MSISITAADIKRKAMIGASDTTYDSAVAALIAEMQGPLEYSIAPQYLDDTSNTNLQATLKLGILEVITGEFLEQLRREAGASEEASVAGVTLGASAVRGVDLIQQGATRLAPYLKGTLPVVGDTLVASTTSARDLVFAANREVW